MIEALGYSVGSFDPANPGRLCRGRERWIEPMPLDDAPELFRVVVSGARFSDDSAADARRGLPFSGVPFERVLMSLFPGRPILAAAEDADPRLVPARAVGVEFFHVTRPHGPVDRWRARWLLPCAEEEEVAGALAAGADVFLALDAWPDWLAAASGAPPRTPELEDGPDDAVPAALREALFLLAGHREADGAPARLFQPTALPDLLEHCAAVALVHRDKHDSCLGTYCRAPEADPAVALEALAEEHGVLAVPFAIPPMLARWDRALWELRQGWNEARRGPFPVPPCPDGPTWVGAVTAEE